ncbi:MAG: 3-isopropylmalate dehydratase small subunit [Actinomycetota bacterium]|nr:3-isopropylmalate dehydratase small subunit [Actinomycetota bacterium]
MEPVRRITGTATPLRRSDVDTDQIIPSEWLKRVERTGFGAGLFAEWRSDPDFVLNQPRFQGSTVLVAGTNFGTGSSREHAVWALQDHGFQAVVSARFADIFRQNCTKAGLLPVQVSPEVGDALMGAVEEDPATLIVIDVDARTLLAASAGISTTFPLDDFTRWRFLEGLDDIDLSLRNEDAIAAYEAARPSWLPTAAVAAP